MDVQASIEIVVWTAVGGRGTLVGGAIIGPCWSICSTGFLTGAFPGTWLYFLGALFVGVVLFFPEGIAGVVGRLRRA